MKKHYLNFVICLLMALTACKNDGNVQPDEISGKWQQTKLNLHQTDAQAVVHDTTYTSNDFTNLDFYQFNRDKTAVISKSGNFSFAGKAIVIPAIYVSDWVTHYSYSVTDTVLTLNPTDGLSNAQVAVPIIKTRDILKLDSHNLVLRTVYDYAYPTTATVQGSYLSGLVATAYFIR